VCVRGYTAAGYAEEQKTVTRTVTVYLWPITGLEGKGCGYLR